MSDKKQWPGPWIESNGPARSDGQRPYTIYWVADYHPGHPVGEYRTDIRGQCYFANPIEQKHHKYATWPGMEAARSMIPVA